jgi:hypothetical protein
VDISWGSSFSRDGISSLLLHLSLSMLDMLSQPITITGASSPPQTETPPDSPCLPTQQFLSSEHAERLVALVKDIATAVQQRNPRTTKNVLAVPPSTPTDSVVTVLRMPASKLEYRTVQEV